MPSLCVTSVCHAKGKDQMLALLNLKVVPAVSVQSKTKSTDCAWQQYYAFKVLQHGSSQLSSNQLLRGCLQAFQHHRHWGREGLHSCCLDINAKQLVCGSTCQNHLVVNGLNHVLGLQSGSGKGLKQEQQQLESLRTFCENMAIDAHGRTALLSLLHKLQEGLASVENMPVHQAQAAHNPRSYRYSGGGKNPYMLSCACSSSCLVFTLSGLQNAIWPGMQCIGHAISTFCLNNCNRHQSMQRDQS